MGNRITHGDAPAQAVCVGGGYSSESGIPKHGGMRLWVHWHSVRAKTVTIQSITEILL